MMCRRDAASQMSCRAFEIPLPTLIVPLNRWADLVPPYEALLFQTRDASTYFGYNGEYTQRMNKTERDVKRFWDIKSDDIQVLAMHGTVLADPSRTVPTYQSPFFLALPPATAQQWAADVRTVMGDGILDGYKAIGFDDVALQAVFAHEFGHHIQFERGYYDELPRAPTRLPSIRPS